MKLILVVGMTLAILVPLMMIRGTIAERQAYRQQAVADIARSYAGAQAVAGPVLVVPYTETVEVEERDSQGVVHKVLRQQDGRWLYFPKSLDLRGSLQPDTRRRGLHEVRVYELRDALASARFDATLPADADPAHPRRIGTPWLSYAIADVRGLLGTPQLRMRIDGAGHAFKEHAFEEHAIEQGAYGGPGIHARLAVPAAGDRLAFDTRLQFTLGGTEALALVPLGDRNTLAIASPWPHPRFDGSFLPRTREVDSHGFRAHWDISSLATNAQSQFAQAPRLPRPEADTSGEATAGIDTVGVSLVEPVNIYVQADRASKYGLLFVLLTFLGFFMFELLKQLPVHPVQYGLVGLALALFFLLLISLSEHIPFAWAYVVSGGACIGLIGFYLSAVLRSAARGGGFAAMLGLLYAALYGLLVSEDNALVLGAGLLFLILAGVMVATRRIDWYRVAAPVGG
jgi:inner membrane protein